MPLNTNNFLVDFRDWFTSIYDSYSRQIILMKEQLARYYRDKLLSAVKRFESPTIKTMDVQISGITFAPVKPNQTLYGATVVILYSFKGGDDWQRTP